MQQISTQFSKDMIRLHGIGVTKWLDQLTNILENLKNDWQLDNLITASNLSNNYVALGFSIVFNSNIALKICPDMLDYTNEKRALKYFQGQGVNKLLAYDDNFQALLLEKIGGGNNLKALFPHNDNEAIQQAAVIIKKLHENPSIYNMNEYPKLITWMQAIHTFNDPNIASYLLKSGINIVDEISNDDQNYVLHGDLHHENILQTSDGKWISIDPKGVIGNIAYEVGAFMRNPVPDIANQENIQEILHNRIMCFSQLLGIDQLIITKYSYLATLLATIWNLKDNGDRWQNWLKILCVLHTFL